MAATFPSGNCSGTSRWQVSGGQWFPVDPQPVGQVCTTALDFRFGSRPIRVATGHGMSDPDFQALRAKYPEAVVPVPGHPGEFALPLVPPGTVVDITPEPSPDPEGATPDPADGPLEQ